MKNNKSKVTHASTTGRAKPCDLPSKVHMDSRSGILFKLDPLIRPKIASAAKQCSEMGLAVGDTIWGCEGSEVMLTLLLLHEHVAVWRVMRRGNGRGKWKICGESTNWTLDCRQWYLLLPFTS